MASSFSEPRRTYPMTSVEDTTWMVEIAACEYAVNRLLEAKKLAVQTDPHHEQVLWTRHIDRLRTIKRKLDAVCM